MWGYSWLSKLSSQMSVIRISPMIECHFRTYVHFLTSCIFGDICKSLLDRNLDHFVMHVNGFHKTVIIYFLNAIQYCLLNADIKVCVCVYMSPKWLHLSHSKCFKHIIFFFYELVVLTYKYTSKTLDKIQNHESFNLKWSFWNVSYKNTLRYKNFSRYKIEVGWFVLCKD